MSLVNDDRAVSLEQEVLKKRKRKKLKKLKKHQENLSLNATNIFIVTPSVGAFTSCKPYIIYVYIKGLQYT